MARTEKTGKVQKKWPLKFLDNSAEYFVCESCKIRYFATQTEAFRYAMPRQLAVFRIKSETTYEKVELRPQTETLIRKVEVAEKAVYENSRFNNYWTTRKSGSKRIKKYSSRHIKFTK